MTATPYNDAGIRIGEPESFRSEIELAQFIALRVSFVDDKTYNDRLITEVYDEKTEPLNISQRPQNMQTDTDDSWLGLTESDREFFDDGCPEGLIIKATG